MIVIHVIMTVQNSDAFTVFPHLFLFERPPGWREMQNMFGNFQDSNKTPIVYWLREENIIHSTS